ncbi:MAG TPA: 3,4-dihydroxy-2-butanone-4-phosphate synthase, partial [Chitinophagaceae bacterium]|nr:3,4-dihydroxy-2-butanone-4-phosphate synthase [Chitinophagaceae bacterium]
MLDTIESAVEDIKNGKLVIVVDDEDRENEGDFITASRNATPEVVNFMSKHGRGLICVPILEERCRELGLELMVNNNTALHETAFTVSVDLLGHGCTTGISAQDRSKTIQALIDPAT